MLDRTSTLVARFRRPEYTGSNRCLPCTAANAGIALVVAGALWHVSPIAGIATLSIAAVTITLRGYLVPGTPALTRRYFPEQVLRRFGKVPPTEPRFETKPVDGRPDPDAVLVSAGVVTDCPERDDLCLQDAFREEWLAAIDDLRGHEAAQRAQLAAMVGEPASAVSLGEMEDGVVFATVDGTRVGQWLSRTALLADVAAAAVLDHCVEVWADMEAETRGTILSVLRVFLERCPACGGAVVLSEETTDTCCWSQESITVRCSDCESRLYTADATSFELATRE